MAWQDRPYYRDRDSSAGNPLMWLLTGSIPLFTIFNIRVRAHASLVVLIALVLLFGIGENSGVTSRVQSMSILFIVILLHEFGHCFAARWTGGEANDILMTPLGGLAMAMARRRPWPTFVTVAGGPLVNVVICLICAIGIWLMTGEVPFLPGSFRQHWPAERWFSVYAYLYWFYGTSLALLLFNILPVFPMDGGQLLQAILWKPLGYYRSMMITLNVGLVGSVLMIMTGLAVLAVGGFGILLMFIGVSCLMNCYQMRAMMRTEGPWAFQDEDSIDYGASVYSSASSSTSTKRKRPGLRARLSAKRARKLAREAAIEQRAIDAILAKVSAHGMQSLSWSEKRALKKATEHQRQRDLELRSSRAD